MLHSILNVLAIDEFACMNYIFNNIYYFFIQRTTRIIDYAVKNEAKFK